MIVWVKTEGKSFGYEIHPRSTHLTLYSSVYIVKCSTKIPYTYLVSNIIVFSPNFENLNFYFVKTANLPVYGIIAMYGYITLSDLK